ncbi:MAG TPA: phosphatidylglycerol lysyltransferase domain-containing protein [Desulfurivibrionaceae bacterium]|nr:phosphatidylglycerol lysyltransferase domain-containing protein [Desulfurivibrionaceae bacterium]
MDKHELTLASRSLVHGLLQRHPPTISELTFTNLFAWRHTRPVWFSVAQDTLLFWVTEKGASEPTVLFGPPIGPLPIEEVPQFIPLSRMVRIPAPAAERLRQAGYAVQEDRDNADYVYRVRDLAELAGRKYAKKRNHVKNCLAQYRCEYEPFSPALIAECLSMQSQWCEMKECAINLELAGEDVAIRETLQHCAEFDCLGGAIRVDGKIAAYAVAEPLRPETAVWHFEKAMPDINGLGQLITHWFAREALAGFTYVNREQDLGIPGLRQAKESYYPDHLVEKFTVRLAG